METIMTLEQWLEDGKSDAYRRKLPELADLLDGLARSTAALRAAACRLASEIDGNALALPIAIARRVQTVPVLFPAFLANWLGLGNRRALRQMGGWFHMIRALAHAILHSH